MKKLISVILILSLLIISFNTIVFAEDSVLAPDLHLMGDVDNDGKVSADDARTVLRYSVGLDKIDNSLILYADMDSDEKISASDARLVLRTAVSLESIQSHKFDAVDVIPVSCETDGSISSTCGDCKKSFTIVLKHKGHNYVENSDPCDGYVFCENCKTEYNTGLYHDVKDYKCKNCNFSDNISAFNDAVEFLTKNGYTFENEVGGICYCYEEYEEPVLLSAIYDGQYIYLDCVTGVQTEDGHIVMTENIVRILGFSRYEIETYTYVDDILTLYGRYDITSFESFDINNSNGFEIAELLGFDGMDSQLKEDYRFASHQMTVGCLLWFEEVLSANSIKIPFDVMNLPNLSNAE